MELLKIQSTYLVQKLIKPSSTSNDTTLEDISHLYNLRHPGQETEGK